MAAISFLPLASSAPPVGLRAATADDVESIAALWHAGWADGHQGHVPEALAQHRQLADFRRLVRARVQHTHVATLDGRAVGFVTVIDDELEQIYVAGSARGRGVADALLRRAEEAIAAAFDRAWLAVAPGNARARRFYARHGWRDGGGFDYQAEIAGGTMTVPCRRYEKRVEGRRGQP
jgi:ribosomal protein S18 acetylase RimI-like enzyme